MEPLTLISIAILILLIVIAYKLFFSKPQDNQTLKTDLAIKESELKAEKNAHDENKRKLEELQKNLQDLKKEKGIDEQKITELENKLKNQLQSEETRLMEVENKLNKQHTDYLNNKETQWELESNKQINEVKNELNIAIKENNSLKDSQEQQKRDYEERIRELTNKYKEDLERQDKLREQLHVQIKEMKSEVTDAFAKVSAEALDQSQTKIIERAKSSLEIVLQPVTQFKEAVETQIKVANENKGAFENQVENLKKATEQIKIDAQNLTEALKGKKQLQGNWGEVQLMNILDISGLRKDIDYKYQTNLKDDESNSQRPDIIVNLPQNKHIIVDSKVSLNNYLQALNALDENESGIALDNLVQDVRNHIKTLSSKNYHKAIGIDSPDYTLMFVPIETAFIAALQHDPTLFNFAMEKKIVIVTPSTLMASLGVIKTIWDQERRLENSELIAKMAADIYDKIAAFTDDFYDIEKKLEGAHKSYTQAKTKLLGHGSALVKLENMKKLGVTPKKSFNEKAQNEIKYLEEENEALDD